MLPMTDMESFLLQLNVSRVLFGSGTRHKTAQELSRLNLQMPFLLSTSQQTFQVEELAKILGENGTKPVGLFTEATMHTPVAVTERAVAEVKSAGADCLISLGGGSTIGLGKAISIRTGLYHLCIPTTYAGSEVTPILGETDLGKKTTRRDAKILPGTVIYDVDLTMTLPPGLSATSGVNAIAHALEAMYAEDTNPIIRILAQEGIRALATALPQIMHNSASSSARWSALYGSWLCGICLGNVGMSLHHKLCHVLGGMLDLPHAETHTIVLPHVLAYNAPCIPSTMETIAQVLPGSDGDAIRGLNTLLDELGVKRDLRSLGMAEEDVARVARATVNNPYYNPRNVEEQSIAELVRRAWAGESARADL